MLSSVIELTEQTVTVLKALPFQTVVLGHLWVGGDRNVVLHTHDYSVFYNGMRFSV